MKLIKILCLCLILNLCSCAGTNPDRDQPKEFYKAVNRADTATLRLNLTDKAFYGQFEINYHGAYKDSGGVTGIIKGDTLRGTYRFQHYGIEKWHSMPIALLKKNNRLIMGEGLMEIYMGMYYFKKNTTINYQNPRFVFEKK